ncbi:histidine kinase dimerization/phosphoacceptor domain -containing protein [uncultured Arcticibacterium sp.]|uniref:sensor histidine kinase n=1 Tax=uncultured Arcticibacterium sp. TaxID=2173042 RepID=UPI0030F60C86
MSRKSAAIDNLLLPCMKDFVSSTGMKSFIYLYCTCFFFLATQLYGQHPPSTKNDSNTVLKILAHSKTIRGNRDSVFVLSKKALTIAEAINFEKGIALSKEKMAGYFHAKSDYANAVSYSLEVIDLYEKLGMIEESLLQKVTLSTIYKHIGAERSTVDYLIKGLDLANEAEQKAEELKLTFVTIESLNNQGIILRDLRYIQDKPVLMDSAHAKYQKAILLLESLKNDNNTLQKLYNNISQVYIEHLHDYDQAKEVLDKAVNINQESNSQNNLSYNYANLSNLYLAKKDYKKAKDYALKMLQIGNDLKRPHRVLNAYGHLSTINKEAMNYDSALYYQEKKMQLNDSLTNLSKTEQIADFQTKYETVKKDAEIEGLNRKADLARFRTWVFIGGLVLLSFLALLLYNRYLLKKKTSEELSIKNAEIENKNSVIQAALTEKETLLREIHHRVKNNLQIISSLLNIQSSNIDDPSVLSSIQEGQSRVQAMSLIHQNLYQSEHINDVDIENYLKELVNYLSDMFTGSNKKIEIEVSASDIQFDIDTAIPLGLIVNELVSNAYKYAFDKRDSGKIKVGIKALNKVDYELNVNDDGEGLPKDFDPAKSKSLGLKLVKILSKQLRGKFSSGSDNGANFTVFFKDIRAYQAQS